MLNRPREFPSLSGASQQSQSQNPGLAWANAGQRAGQQAPIQRQQPPSSQPPSRMSQTQSHPQTQSSHDDLFPSGSQFANRLDDFRNGGQGISSQLGAGSQPQTGNIDEFPPLGRNVTEELGQDRRESLLQSTGFGNYNGGMPFGGLNQAQAPTNHNLMSGSVNGQESARMMSPTSANAGGIATTRSPASNGILGHEKDVTALIHDTNSSLTLGRI